MAKVITFGEIMLRLSPPGLPEILAGKTIRGHFRRR